ncbi:hypothetical protein [Aquimarina algiphila]|nr:hypothetical protein [Aquimarina algiphila]
MEKKKVNVNAPQMTAIEALKLGIKYLFLEWARGTGKSTILGWVIKDAAYQLPRATGVLVGQTYQQMLSRTLPSTKEGLSMFGFYQGIDYVVGRHGKKLGFAMPFQAPSKWENVIHFRNGFILILVALDNPNSGRGINSYIVVGDEAALMNPEKLFNNVQTTNRAKKVEFEKSKLLNAEIFASSTPMTQEGKWFANKEQEIIDAHKGLNPKMRNPEKHLFIKANAFANAQNLDKDWFDRMMDKAPSKMHYNAEILNIRPNFNLTSFYPQLDKEKHYYEDFDNGYLESIGVAATKASFDCKQDKDRINTKPLILSLDWGVFNSMKVSQDTGKDYKCLKTFFVKSPKIIDDLINEKFAPYYASHAKKVVHLYYDRNGNSRRAGSRITLAQQAINCLKQSGWEVIVKTPKSLDPPHNEKFIVINYVLKNGGKHGLPKVGINKHNCKDLIISLESAPAKEGKNGIEKDKRSERSKVIPQEHATHFSDAFDLPIYWRYKEKVLRLITGNRTKGEGIPLFVK